MLGPYPQRRHSVGCQCGEHSVLAILRSMGLYLLCALVLFSVHQYEAAADQNNCMLHALSVAGVSKSRAATYLTKLTLFNVSMDNLRTATDFSLRIIGISDSKDRARILECFVHSTLYGSENEVCSLRDTCNARGACSLKVNASSNTKLYGCICEKGFSGDFCETDICQMYTVAKNGSQKSRPRCQNGGLCNRTASNDPKSICVCKRGYSGTQCENETNNCLSNPCHNGGRCQNLFNNFTCYCRIGYTGRMCQEKWLTRKKTNSRLKHLSHTMGIAIDDAISELASMVRQQSDKINSLVSTVAELDKRLLPNQRPKQYRVYTVPVSHSEATYRCNSVGGELPMVKTSHQQWVILRLASAYRWSDTWLDGSDLESEGTWMWRDGMRMDLTYTNWLPGEPSNSGGYEHCLTMRANRGGFWNDGNCNGKLPYICQMY